MDKKYFELQNEGGEGYKPQPADADSRTADQLIWCLEDDLRIAEQDGLTYKAGALRERIAGLKSGGAK